MFIIYLFFSSLFFLWQPSLWRLKAVEESGIWSITPGGEIDPHGGFSLFNLRETKPHFLPYGKDHSLKAIEVLKEDIENTLLEDPSAPLKVSKVADLVVPTRVKSYMTLPPLKKTFQHDDLSFMVVAGRPVYSGRSYKSSRKRKRHSKHAAKLSTKVGYTYIVVRWRIFTTGAHQRSRGKTYSYWRALIESFSSGFNCNSIYPWRIDGLNGEEVEVVLANLPYLSWTSSCNSSQSATVRLHQKSPSMVGKITRCGQVFTKKHQLSLHKRERLKDDSFLPNRNGFDLLHENVRGTFLTFTWDGPYCKFLAGLSSPCLSSEKHFN